MIKQSVENAKKDERKKIVILVKIFQQTCEVSRIGSEGYSSYGENSRKVIIEPKLKAIETLTHPKIYLDTEIGPNITRYSRTTDGSFATAVSNMFLSP